MITPPKDLATYSIGALYAAGLRFIGEFTESDAVDLFLDLHPGATRDEVEANLRDEMLNGSSPP